MSETTTKEGINNLQLSEKWLNIRDKENFKENLTFR